MSCLMKSESDRRAGVVAGLTSRKDGRPAPIGSGAAIRRTGNAARETGFGCHVRRTPEISATKAPIHPLPEAEPRR